MSGMMEEVGESGITFVSIVGGVLSQKCSEDTPGAKKREYTIGTGDEATTGVKWELRFKNLKGRITAIDFNEGKFGEQCIVTMQSNGEKIKLAMGTSSKYFTSFAKVLPNIQLNTGDSDSDVHLSPYDFKDDKEKQITGMSVKQDGQKIEDYYWDGKASKNGIPVNTEDYADMTSKKWRRFFEDVEEFLIEKVREVEVPEFVDTYVAETEEGVKEDEFSEADMPTGKATEEKPVKKKEATKKDAEEVFDDGMPPF